MPMLAIAWPRPRDPKRALQFNMHPPINPANDRPQQIHRKTSDSDRTLLRLLSVATYLVLYG